MPPEALGEVVEIHYPGVRVRVIGPTAVVRELRPVLPLSPEWSRAGGVGASTTFQVRDDHPT